MSTPKKITFCLLILVFLLAQLELLARLALPRLRTASLPGWMISQHLGNSGLRYDPDLYWYWPRLPIRDLEVNAHGFRRSRPMTLAKPPGVRRVVTLGDSQMLGVFMPTAESLSAVAEEALGQGWEVLNAAVPGYRSLNIYRLLQRRIEAYAPDVLVVDCMAYDSARDDGPIQGLPLGTGPLMRLAWESRLLYGLRHLAARLRRRGLPPVVPNQSARVYEGGGNHDLIKAWGEARGVKVLFMDYPFITEAGALVCLAPARLLPRGAALFGACAALRASGHGVAKLFFDNNHMSPLGNRVVGQALARRLAELSWR